MTQIKYSPLRNQEIHTKPKPSIFSTSKICGFFSCILVAGCVCVSIALAKLTTENKFLQSPYTNYTSSYSFGVVSDFHLDLSLEKCCQFETDYSCICCPNNPTLLNATFHSFVKVLRMYVNTKFIFYLGNIASKPNQTIQTYSYFSDFIRGSAVNIPVYPTLGINDRTLENSKLFYAELYPSWIDLINCFGCPLAADDESVKDTITTGGYYAISTSYGAKIISINTNLFLKNATFEEKAEGEGQIAWLEKVLLASTADTSKSKMLIGGTAPGYSTKQIWKKKSGSTEPTRGEWDPYFLKKFTSLLSTHQFRWSGIFMGGVEFELVRLLDKQYMFLTPPCSPRLCSDPVFRVAFLSERDLELLDLHQYYSPIEFFTRVGKAPKYMFDYSYERVIFGSQQPRGPVYLNTYSISQFYLSLIESFNLPRWETLSFTKKIDKDDGFGSPLVTYCTTQNSNITLQLECLKKYKFEF